MGWKTEFFSVWECEENKSEKPGENFLPRPTNFFPANSGGKSMRENCLIVILP